MPYRDAHDLLPARRADDDLVVTELGEAFWKLEEREEELWTTKGRRASQLGRPVEERGWDLFDE
ncbi:MAG: hypothetical protein Q9175_002881 [Cornicularia normoerica]